MSSALIRAGCLQALFACAALAQTTTSSEPQPFGDRWFEGTVGNAAVRMYVGDAGWPLTEGLWGIYFFEKSWEPIPLEGKWAPPERLQLTEGEPGSSSSVAKPHLDLDVSNNRVVEGTWTSADGARLLPVRLKKVPTPPSFEVAVRRPRRFVSPTWPIALTYPTGWRLDADDHGLRLRSPDPRDALFDKELTCRRGTGVPAPPAPGESPVELDWPFFRGASGWLVEERGWGDCDEDRCQPAESRPGAGGSFMKGHAGSRSYSPWGYMGAGESEAYLIVAGQEWVTCSDRLLDKDTRIEVIRRRARPN